MTQSLEILLDAVSILDKVVSLRLERRREQAVDTLTLELADYSLYAAFDFGVVPTAERLEVLIDGISQGLFFIEKPDVAETRNQVSIPSLWGRSSLAGMLDPFAGRLTRSFTQPTSLYALVPELMELCGLDSAFLQIDIADFAIPAGVYSISNQYPLQVVIDLAAKSNGIVRSKRDGTLWIQKDLYHFDALAVAQAWDDDDIEEVRESLEYPQFGNRILVHSSISAGGLNSRIRLRLETSCIRGDGFSTTVGEAVVTDGSGNAVADGTGVDWSISNSALAEWAPTTSLTFSRGVSGEIASASGLMEVSTSYPIRDVLGVYLENDQNRATNYYTGGAFLASTITLGSELPFTDSRLVIDYVAGGLATSSLESIAGAPQMETTVHASVGKARDSQTFCINNNRNVSISISASKTEYNLCLGEQTAISDITAQVKIDGEPGSGAMVSWLRTGGALGTLAPRFSAVKNQTLTERVTSQNNFTVSVQHEISSVTSVMLETSSTNYYTARNNRRPSFNEKEIILGTNLPDARMPVIVVYVATAIVIAKYTNPTTIGADVITATLSDRTSTPESASVSIVAMNSCTEGPTASPPAEPGGNDCENSVASAQNCEGATYPNSSDPDKTECICRRETGTSCPTTEEECRAMCEGLYNKYGLSPLNCDRIPTEKEIAEVEAATGETYSRHQEAAAVSCSKESGGDPDKIEECIDNHRNATIDRCAKKCMDHGLQVSPRSGSIACSGAKSLSFSASGGKAPYAWTTTVGNIKVSGNNGQTAVLTPPTNTGSAQVGDAYSRRSVNASIVPPSTCGASMNCARFGCNDQSLSPNAEAENCGSFTLLSCDSGPPCSCTLVTVDGTFIVTTNGVSLVGPVTDKRNAAMILAGCNPCGINFSAGAVVTVTDAKGRSASAAVTA